MKKEIKLPTSFFFSGGGFSCCFHIGVYKAISEIWEYKDIWKLKFIGNSGGALVSYFILNKLKYQELEKKFIKLNKMIENNGINNLSNYVNKLISELLKKDNDYKKFNNKLFIGITKFPNTYVVRSVFKSNKDLIDTLHSSMYIPFYTKYLKKVDNKIYIDGDILGNYHLIDDTTITISTWNNKSDIYLKYPIKKINIYFSSDYSIFKKIIEEGYNSFNFFINVNGGLKREIKDQHMNLIRRFIYSIVALIFYFIRFVLEIINKIESNTGNK
jgi:hypothetical protein